MGSAVKSNRINAPTCLVCDSQNTLLFFKSKMAQSNIYVTASGFSRGNRDLYKCLNCTLIFCFPMPDKSLLFEDYSSSVDSDFVSQNKGRVTTFSKTISRINCFKNLTSESLIVDIGSASGAFLSAAKNAGFHAVGFEPSKWMVEYGKQAFRVDLRVGDVFSIKKEINQPQVITMWDVLEHLAEPKIAIDIVAKKLQNKGFIIISLPDSSSFSARLLRRFWPMHLDVHLSYFNEKSLKKLLNKNNFELVEKFTYFQTLSLGYLILRLFRMFTNIENDGKLHSFLLKSKILNLNIKYSIGQKVFVFQKSE